MENKELLQQILAGPTIGAFSRIRYVRNQMSEEEQAEFLAKLYVAAVETREAGKVDPIADLLEEWEAKGVALAGARASVPEMGATPWAPMRVPISKAKIALVTTGGFYVENQPPFETDGPEHLGDWSFRAIPRDTPRDKINISHIHYDLSGPREDINCVFPLDRFAEMEMDGTIGKLAETAYSFMGFIQRPDLLMTETAPEVARLLKADGVDAVFLTST
jgi:D-proline reductase (dithiol) PrdB